MGPHSIQGGSQNTLAAAPAAAGSGEAGETQIGSIASRSLGFAAGLGQKVAQRFVQRDGIGPLPQLQGRSPDAQKIYETYCSYYTTLNGYIDDINGKYPNGSTPPHVVADLNALQADLTQLGSIYQSDYANSNKTLDDFESDCEGVLSAAQASYADGMGSGGTIHDKIEIDYQKATTLLSSMQTAVSSAEETLDQVTGDIATYQKQLTTLKAKIDAMPSGDKKNAALADYQAAEKAISSLQDDVTSVTAAKETFSGVVASLQASGGPIDQLKALESLSDPTKSDLETANGIITSSIAKAQSDLTAFTAVVATLSSDDASAATAVQKVNMDVNPPKPGTVQHACWYIDWTKWFNGDFPMPEGVDTINIFVGELDHEGKGIGGFGNLPDSDIGAFVKAAKAKGVTDVKISIGGGGGAYDDTWDLVTEDNYESWADKLVAFCAEHDLSGVDFDYEEFKPSQEPVIGKLINAFKKKNPSLKASLCTNAGFGGWSGHVKRILDETKDEDGHSCLDRLYIMSYYDSLQDEKGWLTQWANWIKTEYGMGPGNLGVGIDDFDAHAYDPAELKAWAEEQGYSWSHWAYDPSKVDQVALVDAQRVRRLTVCERIGRIWNEFLILIGLREPVRARRRRTKPVSLPTADLLVDIPPRPSAPPVEPPPPTYEETMERRRMEELASLLAL